MGSHQLSRPRRLSVALVAAAALWPGVAHGGKKSFIPIPEIITDPNEGNTIGLLGVLLFLDEKDQIQYMLAPDVRYNKTTGIYPAFRFFGYPSPQRRYSVVAAKSTTKDEDYELEYTDRSFWEGRGFVLASFLHEADSTERFFGARASASSRGGCASAATTRARSGRSPVAPSAGTTWAASRTTPTSTRRRR